jgi:hypothetical protein
MSTARPLTEPAIASQDRAADDSERVPTHGRDWLFLLLSAGMAALLAIGTSLVSTFAGNTFWAYVASAACALVTFFLFFLGFLRLRGSIRDAVAGSFLLGLFLVTKPAALSSRSTRWAPSERIRPACVPAIHRHCWDRCGLLLRRQRRGKRNGQIGEREVKGKLRSRIQIRCAQASRARRPGVPREAGSSQAVVVWHCFLMLGTTKCRNPPSNLRARCRRPASFGRYAASEEARAVVHLAVSIAQWGRDGPSISMLP